VKDFAEHVAAIAQDVESIKGRLDEIAKPPEPESKLWAAEQAAQAVKPMKEL
jgi:hypothetical protein